MGIFATLKEIRGGYPGGWKKYSHGKANHRATPPFVQPTNPDDRRSLIPSAGLKEYWYPALPARDVGSKRPSSLKIADEELVFFRDKNDEVQALWDYCPHRGVYLSWGQCFFKGFLTCSYHGATFDGDGECAEFLTEGPDSKMVGAFRAKKYPTITLKGMVFVWMGEGEPVDPKEDIPQEMFEGKETAVFESIRYWNCNWMVALENTHDSHNAFFVHRNAIRVMFSARGDMGGRPRTPLGYRSRLINNKMAMTEFDNGAVGNYYADKNGGKMPYKMYHPRVGANWPLSSWRLSWVWFFRLLDRSRKSPTRTTPSPRQMQHDDKMSDDWQFGGMRLPGMQRLSTFTRWCVPVDKDMTRVVYITFGRAKTRLGRLWVGMKFKGYQQFLSHFNFSDQDYNAMRSTRWQYPEYLSATDSHLVAERRLVADHARGLKHTIEVKDLTTAERQVIEGHERQGVKREDDYGIVAANAANGAEAEQVPESVPTGDGDD